MNSTSGCFTSPQQQHLLVDLRTKKRTRTFPSNSTTANTFHCACSPPRRAGHSLRVSLAWRGRQGSRRERRVFLCTLSAPGGPYLAASGSGSRLCPAPTRRAERSAGRACPASARWASRSRIAAGAARGRGYCRHRGAGRAAGVRAPPSPRGSGAAQPGEARLTTRSTPGEPGPRSSRALRRVWGRGWERPGPSPGTSERPMRVSRLFPLGGLRGPWCPDPRLYPGAAPRRGRPASLGPGAESSLAVPGPGLGRWLFRGRECGLGSCGWVYRSLTRPLLSGFSRHLAVVLFRGIVSGMVGRQGSCFC